MNDKKKFNEDLSKKEKWYLDHNCSHAHCPLECEHPQPFLDGNRLLCGRCFNLLGLETEMIPCGPDIC